MLKDLKILYRHRVSYLFLLPAVVTLLFFLISPILSGIYLSFQKTRVGSPPKFVGLPLYYLLFKEGRFSANIFCTLKYVIGILGISLPLAYAAALLISDKSRAATFFRVIFLLPWVMPPIVSALLFKSMVDPSFGPITIFLKSITGEQYLFLIDRRLAMVTIIMHFVWRNFSVLMLFIASGIAAIPPETYEAAKMDRAGAWTIFRYITLPLTKIQLFIAMVIITAWATQDAESINALTGGGPGNSTETVAIRVLKEGFMYLNLSEGARVGTILVILSVIFMVGYLRTLRIEKSR